MIRFAFVIVAAVALAACGSSSSTCSASNATASSTITLKNNVYSPSCAKVAKGTEVTFSNQETTGAHTVSADPGVSEPIDLNLNAGDTAKYTFNTAGTLGLHDKIRSDMKMTMIVQ
jgi:plastocyanin